MTLKPYVGTHTVSSICLETSVASLNLCFLKHLSLHILTPAMARMVICPLIIVCLLLVLTPLTVTLYVPSLYANSDANWALAVRKGTKLFAQMQSGCYPDDPKPLTRESLEAIGFSIGEDPATQWPPIFHKESFFETSQVKRFKWTEKEDAYWSTSVDRYCTVSLLLHILHQFRNSFHTYSISHHAR